jgi:isoleucyl-tRNA synthetase
MPFSEISSALKEVWKESYKDKDEQDHMQRGMVLNRGWCESPDSSIELLGDLEEDTPDDGRGDGKDTLENMSNTELFGFPGMLFEVLKNDAVSCLTVF